MTGTEVNLETQAEQIAARGRDALVERMRTAYHDAAAAHADLISLDDERIEAMVQSAADRADGLQWRRALAAVAADELGLSPSEALAHPAVVRAQSMLGAPSYEQSLAEMIARPVPLPAPVPQNGHGNGGGSPNGGTAEAERVPEQRMPEPIPEQRMPESAPADSETIVPVEEQRSDELETIVPVEEQRSDELETVEADDVVLELLPEPDPVEYETEAYDVEASFHQDQVPPAPANPFASQTPHEAAAAQELSGDYETPAPAHSAGAAASAGPARVPETLAPVTAAPHDQGEVEAEAEVTIAAVHLGGVANLPTKREGLSVRLSADGLDIMQGPREIIGRLVWDEIEALEVPNLRARRRSKQVRARLVVRTPHGDASFEVPEVAADDLRDRVEPLMRLYGRQ